VETDEELGLLVVDDTDTDELPLPLPETEDDEEELELEIELVVEDMTDEDELEDPGIESGPGIYFVRS
jgi:hypothetical protein